jgi:type IV secretory pathway VirB3-like protein
MFCPSCGRRTDAPPPDPAELLPQVRTEPRFQLHGLGRPLVVLGVAVALVVAGIVVLATASFGVGVILIVLGVCLLPTFAAGLESWPDTRFARASLNTASRVRNDADVAVQSISTWSRTGRDVVRLRRQQFQLRRERDAKIRELGISAYKEDGCTDELRSTARKLDSQIDAHERSIERALSRAKTRVRKERATVAKTEVIAPEAPTEEDAAPRPRKKAS